MIKRIIKSLLVLTVVLATAGTATRAWFTSQVTAADNQIVTGTLLLAIDSTRTHTYVGTWGYPDAYVVVEDVDGVSTPYYTFEPWTNAEPGAYAVYDGVWPRPAGNFSAWLAIRNKGSLEENYRAYALGDWIDGPRFGTSGCPSLAGAVDMLVSVANVHRYPSDDCQGSQECANLYYGLKTGPWTNKAGVTADNSGPVAGYYNDFLSLAANEFVIYRVDFNLSSTADNCYQGATYEYDLVGQAKQLSAGWQ